MPRLFTAISIPDGILDRLTTYRPSPDSNLRLVARNHLHVTLHFLGEADGPAIIALLSNVRAIPFELRFTETGMFHSRESDDWIFWMGIEPSPELLDLHRRMSDALDRGGIKVEKKPFQPHLTLGRGKPAYPRKWVDDFLEQRRSEGAGRGLAHTPLPGMVVNSFELFQSDLLRDGPNYTHEKSFPLQLG